MFDQKDVFRLSPSMFTKKSCVDVDLTVRELFVDVYAPLSRMFADEYYADRLASAIFYRVPMLLDLGRDLASMNVLELGCGRGLKSIPWARLFRQYWGIDIDAELIDLARKSAEEVKQNNITFMCGNAAEIMKNPHVHGIDEKVDCVIIYAVLEHLTISERRTVLEGVSELLSPGGLLVVCETPNRLIAHDGHSSFLHFFQQIPLETQLAYLNRSPRNEILKVRTAVDPALALDRFGSSVSYHDFEMYLADAIGQMPTIIADGWDFWPSFDEPIRRDEVHLADYFLNHGNIANPAFARFWIEAIFDFNQGAAPLGRPVVRAPLADSKNLLTSRPQCWTLDLHSCQKDGQFVFDISGLTNPSLQFDISASKGAIGMFNSEGALVGEFDLALLRSARVERWHSRAALDLSRVPTTDGCLVLKALGADAELAVECVTGREI